ncbi:MAG TPA: TVP38/TMEM64 family protein [bacterium]|nr:TVP38/TMEM64 family protein [bacterium]
MNAGKPGLRILVGLLILAAAYYLNRYGLLRKSLEEIDALGHWAPFLFIFLYVLTCLFFVPSIVFTFAGGMFFGLSRGFLLSLTGAGIGAVSAFLIGRYLARDWILKRFGKSQKFLKLNQMVRHKGWKIVVLARLSPIFPFFIGNYLFGLTSLSAKNYLAASVIGTVPSTAVYVYLGTLSRDLSLIGSGGRSRTPAEWGLFLVGMMATILLTLYFRRLARKALD